MKQLTEHERAMVEGFADDGIQRQLAQAIFEHGGFVKVMGTPGRPGTGASKEILGKVVKRALELAGEIH